MEQKDSLNVVFLFTLNCMSFYFLGITNFNKIISKSNLRNKYHRTQYSGDVA